MIPHNKPSLGSEEQQAAIRVLNSGWIAQGKEVELFENEFCRYLNIDDGHAVCLSSGTAALFLALWALNAKNKIVGIPVYACSSLHHAIALAGAEEKLFDVSADSPNLNIDIVNKENIDIVIVPHIFGLPVNISKLRKNILVIEDCAQSLGAFVNNVPTGLIGNISIFSFYATKIITSGGQGGMVVSKDKELIDSIRDYREFDCRDDKRNRFNFQLTDLQAAIGRVQLKKLNSFLKKREDLFNLYKFSGLTLLDIPSTELGIMKPIRYRAVLKTSNPCSLKDKLNNYNIKSIIPINTWELLGNEDYFPNAGKLTKTTLSLPLYPDLQEEDVKKISALISK
jgi:perosamine synthetase